MISPRYVANCSLLFTEVPLLDRPAAAKAAGFAAVEYWWPFPSATPPDADVDAFVRAVRDAGVDLAGLNFFAGDMPAGDRGLVSWSGREDEFADAVETAVGIGEQLGVRVFNALYGNRLTDVTAEEQDEVATTNLVLAAGLAGRIGATVLVEPVSGAPHYPIRTAADAIAVLDRVADAGAEVGFLADLYHLTVNGDDVAKVIAEHGGRIAHVQLADAPGRHEPGTGDIPFADHLAALDAAGYDGRLALEYVPAGSTVEGLSWMTDR